MVCTQKVSEQFWRCRNQIFWDTDYTENTDKARLFSVFFREIRASPWRVAMSQIPPLAGAPWSHRGDIFRVRIMETLRARISHANLCVHTVPLRAVHRVHHGHSSDLDDVIDLIAGLQDVHGRAHAEQDWADGLGVAQAGQ